MEKLTEQDGMSLNVVEENLNALKSIFPEAFTEDGIDFEVLRQLLGDEVAEGEEKYGLNWFGKKKARQIALTPSTGTLRPCPEESVDWDTTQNMFIEGDNLEVLKLLQKGYSGNVKMIYIDPPYNSGNDFIYPDNFADNLNTYLKYTNQKDEYGAAFSTNTESSGRFHTNWINLMYPRLKLARNILHEHGAIFISIDDRELNNLRLICNDIFGEENFVATMIWQGGRKNDSKRFSVVHDYIVVYVKNESSLKDQGVIWREQKNGLEDVYKKINEIKKSHVQDFEAASKELKKWFDDLPEGSLAKEHSHYCKVDSGGAYYGDNISSPNYRKNLIFEYKGYQPPANG